MSTPDEVPRPPVLRGCKKCGVTTLHIEQVLVVVSPARVAHFGAGFGMTACGRDATGDGWWWPLRRCADSMPVG